MLLAAGGTVTTLAGAALSYEGPAVHAERICMWTPAARNRLAGRVAGVVRRFRGQLFD